MRDPKRIKRILDLIEKLWTQAPDQRLGQLLMNYGGFTTKDNWNIEDDDTETMLKLGLEAISAQKHYQKTGEICCTECKKPFKKISKYAFQPDCEHLNKDMILSVG